MENNNSLALVGVVAIVGLVGVFSILGNSASNAVTGMATSDVKCEFSWPQKVIIEGTAYRCPYSTPYCWNPGTSQNIAKCCNWRESTGYKNCVGIGPPEFQGDPDTEKIDTDTGSVDVQEVPGLDSDPIGPEMEDEIAQEPIDIPTCDPACPDGYRCDVDEVCRKNGRTCTETGDNGEDFAVKGKVVDTETDWIGFQWRDACEGNKLIEFYCHYDDVKLKNHNCPNGCSDGACLPEGPEFHDV